MLLLLHADLGVARKQVEQSLRRDEKECLVFEGALALHGDDLERVVPGVGDVLIELAVFFVGHFLFGLGLVFGAVFRVTKNVFVLWPFYTPIGGLYTNVREGLEMPFEATYGFLLTIGIMAVIIILTAARQKGRLGT